jgi:DNA polymerase-3 subunit alpha
LVRIKEFIIDAKLSGIDIVPPSVQRGNLDFVIVDENTIAFGLSHIHGVGSASKKIARLCSSASSFYNFIKIVFKNRINKTAIEGVIRCGAADCFYIPRSQMERDYDIIKELPNKERTHLIEELDGVGILPIIEEMGNEETVKYRKEEKTFVPNINRRAKLRDIYNESYSNPIFYDDSAAKAENEEQYLGVSLTTSFEDIYGELPDTRHNCIDIPGLQKGDKVELCVKIDVIRHHITKTTGQPMAFMSVSDRTHTIRDVVVFPKIFAKYKGALIKDNVIYLKGWFDEGIKVTYVDTIFVKNSVKK